MKKKMPLLGSLILALGGCALPVTGVFAQETPAAPFYLAQAETPAKSDKFLSRLNPAKWENPLSRNKKSKETAAQNSSAAPQADRWMPVGTQLSETPEDPFTQRTPESQAANHAELPVMSEIRAAAQPQAPGQLPVAPYELDERTFLLSYQNLMTPQNMGMAQEIRLYASRDCGQTWHLYQKAGPQQFRQVDSQMFTVKVARDGEYWFQFRMQDAQGRERTSAAPATQVVVKEVQKSSATEIAATTAADPGQPPERAVARQAIQRPQWSPDSNAGPVLGGASASARTAGGETFRDSVPFSIAEMDTVYADSERMLPVYRIQRPEPVTRTAAKPVTAPAATAVNTPNTRDASPLTENFALPDTTMDEFGFPGAAPPTREMALPEGLTDLAALPVADDPMALLPESEPAGSPVAPPVDDAPDDSFAADIFASLESPMNSAQNHESHIRYANKPRVEVEYDVSNVGSSGVGRVELWGTLDGGQAWAFLAEDKDRRSPIPVDLKAEGDYGLQIVVLNGAGVGGHRPSAGTKPQMQVTFDRTPPRLVLQNIRLLADFGELEVRWDAEDANFGPQCIVLSWATSLDGTWTAITPQAVANDGVYSWRIPENLPGKVFVRVDAVDLAGNVTSLATGPVITDLSRPNATILNAKPAE